MELSYNSKFEEFEKQYGVVKKFMNAWQDVTRPDNYKKHIDFQLKIEGKAIGYIEMNVYNIAAIDGNEDDLYDCIYFSDSSSDDKLKQMVAGLSEDIWLECMGNINEKLSSVYSALSVVYIRDIFVDSSYYKNGIGQFLLDNANNIAAALGSIPLVMVIALKSDFCEAETLKFEDYIDVSQEEGVKYDGYNFYYNKQINEH